MKNFIANFIKQLVSETKEHMLDSGGEQGGDISISQNNFLSEAHNKSIKKPNSMSNLIENREDIYLSFDSFGESFFNDPEEKKNNGENRWCTESEIFQDENLNIQPLTKQSIEPAFQIEKNDLCLDRKFRRCRFCLVIKVSNKRYSVIFF